MDADYAVAMLHHASVLGQDVLTMARGKIACRMEALSSSLESRIPKYEPYVVDIWDADMIKKELLEKSWQDFVGDVLALRKIDSAVRSMSNPLIGSFEDACGPTALTVDRVLEASKVFVSVISTATLILSTLPNMPKSRCAAKIEDRFVSDIRIKQIHQTNLDMGSGLSHRKEHLKKTTGTNLPRNLTDYLTKELKQLK